MKIAFLLIFAFLLPFASNAQDDIFRTHKVWSCSLNERHLNWEKDGCQENETSGKFHFSARGHIGHFQGNGRDDYIVTNSFEEDENEVFVAMGRNRKKWKFIINKDEEEIMVIADWRDQLLIFEVTKQE